MGTGTLVHSLGSMNLSPMIQDNKDFAFYKEKMQKSDILMHFSLQITMIYLIVSEKLIILYLNN